MKITDIEVIEFKVVSVGARKRRSRWGYRIVEDEVETIQTITKISTDEGAEGYMLGGDKIAIKREMDPLLIGENPLDREKIWNWMYQSFTFHPGMSEPLIGVIDCALWDLFGRMVGLPAHKILGGCREKITAYASTHPNMGKPEDYARFAIACKEQGYKGYKIHAYICWDPHKWQPVPRLPGFPKEDIEVCRAVREAVGDDMILMLDPVGSYTLEEAIWVGRELEKLNYYWLEHPMIETTIEAYRRLTRELDIAILAPEHLRGGVFTRAEWAKQGASNMLRIDNGYGGITGCFKTVNLCQAYGLQCEMHGGGWANSQIMGATTEATCQYFERGTLHPGLDYETPPPYLKAICDPMDDDGNVILTQKPGLGMEFNWDYINDNLIKG